MKAFWHEVCIQAYLRRFELWALALVIVVWLVLAELLIPPILLNAIVYGCFGWFVIGKIVVPYVERKLEQLFD